MPNQYLIDTNKILIDAPFTMDDYHNGDAEERDYIEGWLVERFSNLFGKMSMVEVVEWRQELYSYLQTEYVKLIRKNIWLAVVPKAVVNHLRLRRTNYRTRSFSTSGIYVKIQDREQIRKIINLSQEQGISPREYIDTNITDPIKQQDMRDAYIAERDMLSMCAPLNNTSDASNVEGVGNILWQEEEVNSNE